MMFDSSFVFRGFLHLPGFLLVYTYTSSVLVSTLSSCTKIIELSGLDLSVDGRSSLNDAQHVHQTAIRVGSALI